jgi:hypothetical protein
MTNNNYHKDRKKPYQITTAPLDLDLEERIDETQLISEIVQLENELGRPLNMLDLYCRFDRYDLYSVSYALPWLVEGDVPS